LLYGPQAEGHGEEERESRPDTVFEEVFHILSAVFHQLTFAFGWLPSDTTCAICTLLYIHPAIFGEWTKR
jgi:hypothetical protein